nr:ribonuclease 3-like isoform X2 [Ipomoea batatas]
MRSAWVTAYCYFRRWRATRELPAVWSGLRTALVTAYCYFRRRRVTKKLPVAYVLQFPAVENNYVKCFSGVLLLRLGLVFCFVDLIFNCLGAAAPYVHRRDSKKLWKEEWVRYGSCAESVLRLA